MTARRDFAKQERILMSMSGDVVPIETHDGSVRFEFCTTVDMRHIAAVLEDCVPSGRAIITIFADEADAFLHNVETRWARFES